MLLDRSRATAKPAQVAIHRRNSKMAATNKGTNLEGDVSTIAKILSHVKPSWANLYSASIQSYQTPARQTGWETLWRSLEPPRQKQ